MTEYIAEFKFGTKNMKLIVYSTTAKAAIGAITDKYGDDIVVNIIVNRMVVDAVIWPGPVNV